MPGPRFADAARAYWSALGRKDDLPELPEETFDAFIELLHSGAEEPHAFSLLELSTSPYPALALGDDRKPHRVVWAAELAELETFVHPAEPSSHFFADSHPDKTGRHRVYSLEQGIRGLVEFADVADALHWMAARVEAARTGSPLAESAEERITTLDDVWEDSPTSGFYVLEGLLDAPLTEAYDAYSRGEWPVVDPQVETFRLKRQGPWQRGLALYVLRRFLAQRIVDVPRSLKPAELGKPIRALSTTLTEFANAIADGTVPDPIDALVDAEDAELRKRAREWVARHDAWRSRKTKPEVDEPKKAGGKKAQLPPEVDEDLEDFDDDLDDADGGDDDAAPTRGGKGPTDDELRMLLAKVLGGKKAAAAVPKAKAPAKAPARAAKAAEPEPEEEAPVETPFLRSLRIALVGALDAMIADELLEIEEAKKPALVDELVEAGANARSANHLLKSLTEALIASDQVDEVFASDEQVERFIRSRLERR